MFSIFAYIIFARVFIYIKEFTGTQDAADPFQALILSSEDFLANNNIILQNFLLLSNNIIMLSFIVFYWLQPIYEVDEDGEPTNVIDSDPFESQRNEVRNI